MAGLRLLALLLGASAAAPASAASQADLDSLARQLGVRFEIVDNRPARCPKKLPSCFESNLNFGMPAQLSDDLARGEFRLHFSSVRPIVHSSSDMFQVRHINGDLHVLEPKPGTVFKAGQRYRVKLWSEGHYYSAYFPMPNMFLVSGNLQPRTVEATRPFVDPETGLDILAFVAPMDDEKRLGTAGPGDLTQWETAERAFEKYAARPSAQAAPEVVIVPTPTSASRPGGAPLDLRQGVSLQLSGIEQAALEPALVALRLAGVRSLSNGPQLQVQVGAAGLSPEAYRLATTNGRISIQAADPAAAAHALRSLAQQVSAEGGMLRPLQIEDAPRLPFRGMHLDVARNFHSKAEILKIVEQMSRYKLNKLHLHLADDEGWRLEIKQLPELTAVGAFRCHDPSEDRCLLPQLGAGPERDSVVNGYLSQQDYREILLAAKARHIEVIPSLDMPGHSRAAIRSMEARYRRLMAAGQKDEAERFRLVEPGDRTAYRSIQYYNDNTLNVCIDSTYRFLDTVLDEVIALHAQAGTPLKTYHIGADETAGAWTQSPACRKVMASTRRTGPQLGAMFIERVSASLANRGITVAGWSDGMGHTNPRNMPAAAQSNIWSDLFTAAPNEAHRHANWGWNSVISVPNVLYFDIPNATHPLERGYDWPARSTDSFKVFRFLPENLAANASVMKDTLNRPVKLADKEVLRSGRRIGGVQGQLWSETIRSDSQVDYMLFPRLLAFAERAWHRGDWEPAYRPRASYTYRDGKVDFGKLEADWAQFAAKMPAQLRQLEAAGVQYRIAPPGARIVGGVLHANTEFPGQRVEYRAAGGEWQAYTAPVPVTGIVQLRTRSLDGTRASRTVQILP